MTELEKRAFAEADKVVIGKGMDKSSVVHLRHLLKNMYVGGAISETELLSQHILELQADKGRLTDENKRLQLNEQFAINNSKLFLEQLTEAKDIIRELLENTPVPEVYSDGSCEDKKLLELIAKAEAFLKE